MGLGATHVRYKSTVLVSENPCEDLKNVILNEKPGVLVVEWKDGRTAWCPSSADVLTNPACDVAIIHGELPSSPSRTLVTVRGGPYAELALQIGMGLESTQLDLLHISIKGDVTDAPFKGVRKIIKHIPEINLRSVTSEDALHTIFEEAQKYDTIVLGATASRSTGASNLGPVAEKLLRESPATTILVKTRRPMTETMLTETAGAQAISILVDKWFAENTFHADEFSDLKELMALKEKRGVTISLAMPAFNED